MNADFSILVTLDGPTGYKNSKVNSNSNLNKGENIIEKKSEERRETRQMMLETMKESETNMKMLLQETQNDRLQLSREITEKYMERRAGNVNKDAVQEGPITSIEDLLERRKAAEAAIPKAFSAEKIAEKRAQESESTLTTDENPEDKVAIKDENDEIGPKQENLYDTDNVDSAELEEEDAVEKDVVIKDVEEADTVETEEVEATEAKQVEPEVTGTEQQQSAHQQDMMQSVSENPVGETDLEKEKQVLQAPPPNKPVSTSQPSQAPPTAQSTPDASADSFTQSQPKGGVQQSQESFTSQENDQMKYAGYTKTNAALKAVKTRVLSTEQAPQTQAPETTKIDNSLDETEKKIKLSYDDVPVKKGQIANSIAYQDAETVLGTNVNIQA
jgi:hypothetical protein